MLVRRIPPYPLTIKYSVPEANTDYIFVIEDVIEHEDLVTEELTSNASSQIEFVIPDSLTLYDKSYAVSIYEAIPVSGADAERGDIVVDDNLEFQRPYVDARTLGTTATEIEEYWNYETIARALIDSVCGGFYFDTQYIEVEGNDTDYMPLWNHVYKIIKVWENAELVWDRNEDPQALGDWNYLLTKDKSAIIKDPVVEIDSAFRNSSRPLNVLVGESDSFGVFDTVDNGATFAIAPGVTFPKNVNYLFKVEFGWRVVPSDIVDATKMLINDLKCGKLDYYKRYVDSYSTDQYKIQFNKMQLEGTGNILVDKILDKYTSQTFGRFGAL